MADDISDRLLKLEAMRLAVGRCPPNAASDELLRIAREIYNFLIGKE